MCTMNQEPHQETRTEKKALQIEIYFLTFIPYFLKEKKVCQLRRVHQLLLSSIICILHTLKQKLYPL